MRERRGATAVTRDQRRSRYLYIVAVAAVIVFAFESSEHFFAG